MRRLEMKVQPWVYAVDERPTLNIGPEVNSAFWISLSGLRSRKATSEVMIRDWRRTVECFLVDGKVIWGFTYRVLTELLETPGVVEES